MKKVRAVSMLGLAPAVIGLALPANANAATAGGHQPGSKKVSHQAAGKARAPLASCHFGRDKIVGTAGYRAEIFYSHRCIDEQQFTLWKHQTGLTERVRYYSYSGTRELQTYTGGKLIDGATSWTTFPEIFAYEVCEALVANSNYNNVKYGPICEFATS